MRLKAIIAIVILVASLLLGCVPAITDPTGGTTPTEQGIFNETTAPSESTVAADESTQPSDEDLPLGDLLIGPAGDRRVDDIGSYRIYPGGEMVLPILIQATGMVAKYGVGVLLFIDGQPQPYKTDDEPEYTYIHIFYPEDGKECIYNSRFVPVTGEQGDDLEIYVAAIIYPTYSLSNGNAVMVYTSGTTAGGTRLKYEATPPEDIYPEKQMWLSDMTVSFEDTTIADFTGWSEDDMREKIDFEFCVNEINGRSARCIYNVSENNPLALRFELWGNHYVDFGLTFFVDNIPVFNANFDPLILETQEGKKAIVETMLNLEQFDKESVIYAILAPRNYRSSEVRTIGWLQYSPTIFLLEKSTQ